MDSLAFVLESINVAKMRRLNKKKTEAFHPDLSINFFNCLIDLMHVVPMLYTKEVIYMPTIFVCPFD